MLRTIPAREIKRRGISAVDEMLCEGPVFVIRNDVPTYVILSERRYREIAEELYEAYVARVLASKAEVEAGNFTRFESAAELLLALGLGEFLADDERDDE